MGSSYEDRMAQFEANQKNIHIITKLFLSNGRVEVEFKTKKGNSFVTNSKKDSFTRNSSVTNSKVCRQYSSLICDFGVLPPSLISVKYCYVFLQEEAENKESICFLQFIDGLSRLSWLFNYI